VQQLRRHGQVVAHVAGAQLRKRGARARQRAVAMCRFGSPLLGAVVMLLAGGAGRGRGRARSRAAAQRRHGLRLLRNAWRAGPAWRARKELFFPASV
jgi:hypothetical protein